MIKNYSWVYFFGCDYETINNYWGNIKNSEDTMNAHDYILCILCIQHNVEWRMLNLFNVTDGGGGEFPNIISLPKLKV